MKLYVQYSKYLGVQQLSSEVLGIVSDSNIPRSPPHHIWALWGSVGRQGNQRRMRNKRLGWCEMKLILNSLYVGMTSMNTKAIDGMVLWSIIYNIQDLRLICWANWHLCQSQPPIDVSFCPFFVRRRTKAWGKIPMISLPNSFANRLPSLSRWFQLKPRSCRWS